MTELNDDLLALLACPVCRSPLAPDGGFLRCDSCRTRYPVLDGVPMLRPTDAEPLEGRSPDLDG